MIEVTGISSINSKEKITKQLYSGGVQKNCTTNSYQFIDLSQNKFNNIKLIFNSKKKSTFQIYELSISSKDYEFR